jgi:hypothetical protein
MHASSDDSFIDLLFGIVILLALPTLGKFPRVWIGLPRALLSWYHYLVNNCPDGNRAKKMPSLHQISDEVYC